MEGKTIQVRQYIIYLVNHYNWLIWSLYARLKVVNTLIDLMFWKVCHTLIT